MRSEPECRFEVDLEGVGRYSNVTSWSIQQSYITPADGFEFTVTDPDNPARLRELFRPWQAVTLYVNDRIQLLGRIDSTEGTGPGGVDLRCTGRDYFGAFVDANVSPQFRVTKGDTIGTFLLRLLAPFGVRSVTSDGSYTLRNVRTGKESGAAPKEFQQIELDALHPGDGQGVFQFVTSVLSRHRVTLQPSTSRTDVALVRPAYDGKPLYSLRQSASQPDLTTILSGTARRDYTDVPTLTVARGRGAASGSNAKSSTEVVPSLGPGSPSSLGDVPEVSTLFAEFAVQQLLNPGRQGDTAKVYKPVYYRDDKAQNKEQLAAGLQRELAERLQKTLTYSAEMAGVSAEDGTVFAVDTLATVDDDIQSVHENLWISEVSMGDDGSGARTTLQMIRPGSFAL